MPYLLHNTRGYYHSSYADGRPSAAHKYPGTCPTFELALALTIREHLRDGRGEYWDIVDIEDLEHPI